MKFKIFFITCVVLISFLFLNSSVYNVQNIRSNFPEIFLTIKKIIWEFDQEIENVGQDLNIPLIELSLSRSDLSHFKNLHEKFENKEYGKSYYTSNNTWKKAKLIYKGEPFNIKIRSMGSSPTFHRKDHFISFAVKVSDKRTINNLSSFNLIIAERIRPNRHINLFMANKFDLIYQNEELVRVKINKWQEKLFFMEERVRKQLMESAYNSSLVILRGKDENKITNDRTLIPNTIFNFYNFSHDSTKIKFEKIFNEEKVAIQNRTEIYNRYNDLNNYLLDSKEKSSSDYFNSQYISSYEAVRMILGFDGHGSNDYLPHNRSDGKFYPVVHRDNVPTFIKDSEILESQFVKRGGDNFPLFVALNTDDKVRQNKYKKIYNLYDSGFDVLKKDIQFIHEKYERLNYRGWITQIFRKLNLIGFKNTLEHNLEVIKSYLDKNDPRIEYSILENQCIVKLEPNSMSELKLDKLNFSFYTRNKIQNGVIEASLFSKKENIFEKIKTKNLDYTIDSNTLSITANIDHLYDRISFDMQKIEMEYLLVFDINKISQYDSIKLTTANFKNLVSSSDFVSDNIKRLNHITVEFGSDLNSKIIIPKITILHENKKTLTIKEGTYLLNKDLIIPRNFNLVIDPGVHLILKNDIKIVASRNLNINGTKSNPVIIEAKSDDFSFGSFGVIGNGQSEVFINNLILSGGSETWHNGIYLSGALSIHNHAKVNILNSYIKNNKADDGMNVKFVKELHIKDTKFENNFADHVDLDYCIGDITNSLFKNTIDFECDTNGDGIDISGSNILIQSSLVTGLKDKGISIGEDSRVLIQKNNIFKNKHAVAIKDNSIVSSRENIFRDNLLDVLMFQKKSIFGGGIIRISLHDSQLITITRDSRSQINYLIDKDKWNDFQYIKKLKNRQNHFVSGDNLMYD